MAACAGGGFDPAAEPAAREASLVERLHQGPGAAAQAALSPTVTGPPPSRWSLRAIRAEVDWLKEYTLSGVWRVLQRAGLTIRTAAVQHWSPDPDYLSKQARLEACLAEAATPPGRVVALFLDEMSYQQWPGPALCWGAGAPAPPPVAARGGQNNPTWRLLGSLNASTGQVTYLQNYQVGRRQLLRHYRQLVRTYPQAERLYVIQDNWPVHAHADVLTGLARLPQVELVWLPTYAPWLNPIEKLWRWLRQTVLKVHRLAAAPLELRAMVARFLEQFATGSEALLHYVGLRGDGRLARALRTG